MARGVILIGTAAAVNACDVDAEQDDDSGDAVDPRIVDHG